MRVMVHWSVFKLTRHEQEVLCLVIGLLLVGWAVKAWRAAREPAGPPPVHAPG